MATHLRIKGYKIWATGLRQSVRLMSTAERIMGLKVMGRMGLQRGLQRGFQRGELVRAVF